ncbi:unnamed protein product [Miscanthus lutarioriparius]|uniref:Wall-associated receptor kinase galacturonan-binding domain-containing protein n=1 Tax=Miscanthus lutarioriparius TaxID=422564 RepID=A0A811P646_9POAL|nr:unnamed protein product [Miscanthus lutarioriparius]
MANSCAAFLHPSAICKALLVFISVTAVRAADAGGQGHCPHFSCGDLHNISYPFRRPGDPPECGVKAYELVCIHGKSTIRINTGTYFVTSINYTAHSFRVVDANLDMHSSCPLPRWDQFPYTYTWGSSYWRSGQALHDMFPNSYTSWYVFHSDLGLVDDDWACFINCSQSITNSSRYKPVNCLSANNSFVYVMISVSGYCIVSSLGPSCGYLAMIPIGSSRTNTSKNLENTNYTDIIEYVRKGFSVRFPVDDYLSGGVWNTSWILEACRNNSAR